MVAVGYQADLRDHHRRADLRRRSPTGRSSAPGWSSPASGSPSSTSRSRTWSGAAASCSGGGFVADWLVRRADRLRRWHGRAHQRRYRRPHAARSSRQAQGLRRDPMKPHNLPFVMLGAALLWFGWFGFNAGSEFAADGIAGQAWINTLTATCVAAARLADRGEHPRPARHQPRRRFRCRRRSGRHHPGRRLRSTSVGAIVHRPDRRRAVRPGRRPEVQVRLRRLARRRSASTSSAASSAPS